MLKNAAERIRRALSPLKEAVYRLSAEKYIHSDRELLQVADPLLFKEISPDLERIQEELRVFIPELIDLGAGRNPASRWLALKSFAKITAIDPAYAWYESESDIDEASGSRMPAGVYGGKATKKVMLQNLQNALKKLNIPGKISVHEVTHITGERHGAKIEVVLVPESAVTWLQHQEDSSLPAIALWRVFPSLQEWKLVIRKLRPGGLLMTTGEGVGTWNKQGVFSLASQGNFSGGADILNSALPADRNWSSLKLQPLFPEWEVPYFYKKTEDLEIAKVLVRRSTQLQTIRVVRRSFTQQF